MVAYHKRDLTSLPILLSEMIHNEDKHDWNTLAIRLSEMIHNEDLARTALFIWSGSSRVAYNERDWTPLPIVLSEMIQNDDLPRTALFISYLSIIYL